MQGSKSAELFSEWSGAVELSLKKSVERSGGATLVKKDGAEQWSGNLAKF